MLVGRRDFLKLFGIATAVGALDPSALARTNGDWYSNDRLGVTLLRPPGWSFLSTVDYQLASTHHVLDIEHPEVEQILRNPDALPFVFITKFPESHDGLNPCIGAWDEPIEPGIDTDLEYHRTALGAWRRFLPEVLVKVQPYPIDISGTAGTRSEWEFLFQHDWGRKWRIDVTTLLVFRGSRTLTFHFMQGWVPPAVAAEELRTAESSLVLTRI
jgi:hypothetical protein